MAKNTYTNRTALEAVATFLAENNCEDEELTAKVDAMLKSEQKRADNAKKAPRAKSKETLNRERIAEAAAEAIRMSGEPQTAAWLVDHVDELYTISGANGCMRTAKRLGLVENAGMIKVGDKNATVYRAI